MLKLMLYIKYSKVLLQKLSIVSKNVNFPKRIDDALDISVDDLLKK